MSEWRDISTAPKDGTAILVCRADDLEPWHDIWDYDDDTPGAASGHVWHGGEGWYTQGAATHWMPLPEPPTTGQEGE